MVAFIARMIERAAESSIAAGRMKYKAYFVRTKLYARYQDDVNAILISDGYEEIVL